MFLYSYKGLDPNILPHRIRLDDGTTRTSLSELSKDELEILGFVGPITKPNFDENIERIEWVNGKYQIIPFSEEKLSQKNIDKDLHQFRKKLEKMISGKHQ